MRAKQRNRSLVTSLVVCLLSLLSNEARADEPGGLVRGAHVERRVQSPKP